MDMLQTILNRRSVRQYTDEPIPEEKLNAILYAGLAAASSKNRRPWEFVLVQNRAMLDRLCNCRPGAGNLLGKCRRTRLQRFKKVNSIRCSVSSRDSS